METINGAEALNWNYIILTMNTRNKSKNKC